MSVQIEVARRPPLKQGVRKPGSTTLVVGTGLVFLISVAKILADAELVSEVIGGLSEQGRTNPS